MPEAGAPGLPRFFPHVAPVPDASNTMRTAMADSHSGSCFCGAVGVEVTGAPEAMGYCHCGSCRSWSAGPVNAFTLW